MKRIILAGILGAVAVYIWSSISWMAIPWHDAVMGNLANEDSVVAVLKDGGVKTGVYYFPGMMSNDKAEVQAWTEKHRRGPLGFLVYVEEGKEPWSATPFIMGFILDLIAALLIAYLLSLAAVRLKNYWGRVCFVTLIALFAAVVSHGTMWNWFYFPAGYTLVNMLDLIIGWFFGGLVIAWLIKPESA